MVHIFFTNLIAFPMTFVGPTLECHYSLSRNSIDSFDTFCMRFSTRFTECKPMVASSTSLHNVLEGDNESLRQYMASFV